MKKLLLIVLLFIVLSSCTNEYKKTEIKTVEGVTIQVDSTKFKPAMVYVDDVKDVVYIAQEGKINKIVVYDVCPTIVATLLFCTLIFALVIIIDEV